MKLIFLVIFITFTLNAKTINFQEEKYIDAIGQTVYNKGQVKFFENRIELSYKNSSKILIEKQNELFVKQNGKILKIQTSDQLALKIVFSLIKAIQKDDYELLKEFFIVNIKDNTYTLTPKENVKNYIEKVEFKKRDKLDFITIFMNNGDKTIIREIND